MHQCPYLYLGNSYVTRAHFMLFILISIVKKALTDSRNYMLRIAYRLYQ